jgi:curved DNA-binding protein CbpA
LTDFQILGIEETDDPAIIKSAFRKRIKEVHPDRCPEADAFRNHLLFIQINQAYTRLLGNASKPARGQSAAQTAPRQRVEPGMGGALVESKDPAYAFYKAGVKHFMQIHPSRWNDESQLQVPIRGDTSEEQERLRLRVKELIKLFPKAYYYFSIVVHEYPESVWARDARDKMTLIEDRTRMYKKIIESFGFLPDDGRSRRAPGDALR